MSLYANVTAILSDTNLLEIPPNAYISLPAVRGKLELAWIIIIYSLAFNLHTRFTAIHYRETFAKDSKHIDWILGLHIFAGVSELLFFHVPQCSTGIVMPDKVSVVLCLLQSATNLMLAKFLRRGIPVITRPSYQAGALIRPILSILAYINQDADIHRSSVKIVNAFIYTRGIIWLLQRYGLRARYTVQYAIAVPTAAMLSMVEGSFDSYAAYRILAYQGLIALICVTSYFVTQKLENRSIDEPLKHLEFLAWAGFSSIEYIQRKENDKRPDTDPYETPVTTPDRELNDKFFDFADKLGGSDTPPLQRGGDHDSESLTAVHDLRLSSSQE